MGKSLLVLVLNRLIRKAVRCFASPRVLVCDAITIHRIDVKVSARQHTKIPGKLLSALPKIGISNNLHSTEKVSFWQSCQGFHMDRSLFHQLQLNIFLQRLNSTRVLCDGARLGSVSCAEAGKTRELVIARNRSSEHDLGGRTFMHEVECMLSVRPHPGFVKFCGFLISPNRTIVTEKVPNGSLHDVITGAPCQLWGDTERAKAIFGVASAMMHLHALGIVNGNLKATNVLLDENYEPKLIDYAYYEFLEAACGLDRLHQGKDGDVYAFGKLVFLILYGLENVGQMEQLVDEIVVGDSLIKRVMKACLGDNKPSFAQIVFALKGESLLDGVDKFVYESYVEKCMKHTRIAERDSDLFSVKILKPKMESAHFDDLEKLKREAEEGNMDSMVLLGRRYLNSDQLEEAMDCCTKAAEHNHVYGIYNKGICLLKMRRRPEAMEYLKIAADKKVPIAMYKYGQLLMEDHKNDEALRYLQDAQKKGVGDAGFYMGQIYESEKRFYEAYRWYEQAGNEGCEAGECEVARLLIDGEGCEQDHCKAVTIYKKLAEKKNVSAMVNLGILYEKGKCGLRKDARTAAKLFKEAADSAEGSADACAKYAICLSTGNGVDKDVPAAVPYYEKAIEMGNIQAMGRFADVLWNGDGVERDDVRAAQLWKETADRGSGPGMFKYAMCFAEGRGVAKDIERSKELLRQAADKGYQRAREQLESMNKA